MFGKSFFLLAVLGAAVGAPYVASEWPKWKAKIAGEPESNRPGLKAVSAGSAKPVNPAPIASAPNSGSSIVDELPLVDMSEAFRFNVTPAWVISRWPRVSSGLPDEHLQGLRVALISGMRDDDIAGSLTYYFVPSQKCAKITFSGTTGNPQRLIALMTQRFGFQGFTNGEPGVQRYEIRWNGKAHSEFTIRAAPVVRSSSPLERYQVQLAITEPSVK